MSLSNYVVVSVGGIGVVAALSVGSSWAFAQWWGRPKRQLSDKTPADHGLSFEAAAFSSHGVELKGWLITPDRAPFPTVVVPHGWASNAARMLAVAAALSEEGFGVLLYDSRGHGTSGRKGPVSVLTFAQDLTAAVDYLVEQHQIEPERLGVVGHSMGGAAAIVAASAEPRIRAVVASSAFADPVTLTRRTLRCLHIPRWPFSWLIRRFVERHLGTSMTNVAPQNRIRQIAAPVLLLHGAADDLIPASDMDAIYAEANQANTERVLLPDRGHRDVIQDPIYGERVVRFLHQALEGPIPESPESARWSVEGISSVGQPSG